MQACTLCCVLAIYFCCCFFVVFVNRKERHVYHGHRQKARSQPDKYLCIIIDGMDQQKTSLPLLRKAAKSTSSLYRLRTHLTGALLHTCTDHGKRAHVFIDLLQWPHDSNLTISILNRVLLNHIAVHGHLPQVLYLQMDNTSRENKNRYVLGYCAFLIEARIFQKVQSHLTFYNILLFLTFFIA